MPLDFPASPSLNDTYTFNGRTWLWNGTGWQLQSPELGTSGIADGAVTEAKLASNSVTSAKIVNGTIAPADLSTGAPSWDSSGNQTFGGGGTFTGNLTLSGTGRRYIGDFSNATLSSRTAFQSSTTNGASNLVAIPNGTGNQAGYLALNSSSPDNASWVGMYLDGTASYLASGKTGTGSYLPLAFYTSGVERMRINSSGQILSAGAGTAALPVIAKTDDTNTGIWFPAADTLAASTNGVERMRIEPSGRFLVGTSASRNSDALLQAYKASGSISSWVESDSLADGQFCVFIGKSGSRQANLGVYKHSGITNTCAYFYLQEEDGGNAFYWTDNSGNFRISSTGDHIGTTSGTVVGTQTSDERLKNIHGPVEYGLETVKQLEPVRFALKSDPDHEQLGFIAQQVQPFVPQSVFDTNEHIEGEPEDAPTKIGMEYVALIPVLVNAIKELSAEVDALKAQLS